jgi:hypothetical protein
MAGIIVADTIQSGGSFIRLNSASQTVATINASGIYANTGNLLIAANGTIGVASITNTAITGTITQAQIGSNVTTTGPAFSVYKSSDQSISGGVFTKIQFGTEEFDTASAFDSSTNFRFTPSAAGYYQVNAQVSVSAFSNRYTCYLYKNGSSVRAGLSNTGNASNDDSTNLCALIYLNGTTDYIEIFVQGNNSATVSGGLGTYFQAFLARAA